VTLASRLNFEEHRFRLGSDDAARVDFHRMLTALIQVQYRAATEVRANPGDWGIDTFVGSLVDKVNIWQSKYFYGGLGKSQQAQVRESLKSAMSHAQKHAYTVETWTLCVPCELDGPERKWWDGRIKAWKRAYPGVVFELWDAPKLRGLLMSPDADHVLHEFYGPSREWTPSEKAPSAAVVPLPAGEDYQGALFVAQLAAAGLREINSQKVAFFNAEILARDVVNRGVPEERNALLELDYSVWELWEQHAESATAATDIHEETQARDLFRAVMEAVRRLPTPGQLPVRAVHSAGMMHRVVDTRRAGWVSHWRDVAAAHTSPSHVAHSQSTTVAVGS
jgi:hypothetical protein